MLVSCQTGNHSVRAAAAAATAGIAAAAASEAAATGECRLLCSLTYGILQAVVSFMQEPVEACDGRLQPGQQTHDLRDGQHNTMCRRQKRQADTSLNSNLKPHWGPRLGACC